MTVKNIDIQMFAKDAPVVKALENLTERTKHLRGLAKGIKFDALDDKFKIKAKEVLRTLDKVEHRTATAKVGIAGAERMDGQLDRLLLKLKEIGAASETATVKVRKRGHGFFGGLMGAGGSEVEGILGKLGSVLSLGGESIGGTAGGAAGLSALAGTIAVISQGLAAATVAAGGLGAALAPIAGPIMGKLGTEWSAFSKQISGTRQGKAAISAAAEAFHMLLVNLTPVVIQMLPKLTRLFKDIGQSATSGGIEQFLKWLAIHGPKAFDSVAHATRLAGHAIHAMAPVFKLIEAVAGAFFKILSAGFDIIGGVIDLFTGNWKAAGREFGKVAHNIGSAFSGLWHAIERLGKDIFGWFGNLGSHIVKLISGLPGMLYRSGKSAVQAFINGMTGMFGPLGAAVHGLMSIVGDFLPHSPAKVGPLSGRGSPDLAGQRIALMLANGMRMGTRYAARAAGQMAGAVSAASMHAGVHAGARGTQPIVLEFRDSGGDSLERELFKMLAHQIRVRGGNPVILTQKVKLA